MSGGLSAAPATAPVLELCGVGARVGRRWIVRGISLQVGAGELLAVVGSSGAGKSTLARLAVGLTPVAEGQLRLEGRDWAGLPAAERRRLRPHIGYVQQDPQRALDPAMTVAEIICEGLELQAAAGQLARPAWGRRRREWRLQRAGEWLERVGVSPEAGRCQPHQLSGGQRQRVAIARALITLPHLLVADEPTAALDAATGAQLLETLARLQRELKLAVLLVSHQLPQVARCAQRLAVLEAGESGGRIVEQGPVAEVLGRPRAAMTRALLAAVPPWPAPPATGI